MKKLVAQLSVAALSCFTFVQGAEAAAGRAVPGDFDGSGLSDIAVTRVYGDLMYWYVRHDNGFEGEVQFGRAGDIPISFDYDGNGKYQPAVIRNLPVVDDQGNETIMPHWLIRDEATGEPIIIQWGLLGDAFLTGYFDNDGAADLVAVRPDPNTGYLNWFIKGSRGTEPAPIVWGHEGNSVFAADLNGDGIDEIIAAGPAAPTDDLIYWYALTVDGGLLGEAPFFGRKGDTLLPPYDVDNDGIADFIVVREHGGLNHFFIRLNNPDLTAKEERVVVLGFPSDIPFVGSFFRGLDAKTAVFRRTPVFATFFIDINGDPFNPMTVPYALENDTLVIPGVATASAPTNRLSEVCQKIFPNFPGGVLYKQSSDHSGAPREGKPAALFKNRAPNQTTCLPIYATNGEQVTAFTLWERNGHYGTRYYSGTAPSCNYPSYGRGQIAEVAAGMTGGNPQVYLQWQPGECIGPFDPTRRHGGL